jgi:zinc transporter ZupT
LIPEAESEESDLPTLALMVGFALMMLLDIAFS